MFFFSIVLVSFEKIYQTLKTVFDHILKHPEVHQKYAATCRIFNSFFGVWKCGQTPSFVFDILRTYLPQLLLQGHANLFPPPHKHGLAEYSTKDNLKKNMKS